MTPFHNTVSNDGIISSDDYLTFNLAAGITTADVGKAVSIDTSAANKVKLCGVGDIIFGRLEVVEQRSASQLVGTVSIEFSARLPIGAAQVINVGDTVVGFATGTVKAAAAPDYTDNVVLEVIGTSYVVVLKK